MLNVDCVWEKKDVANWFLHRWLLPDGSAFDVWNIVRWVLQSMIRSSWVLLEWMVILDIYSTEDGLMVPMVDGSNKVNNHNG